MIRVTLLDELKRSWAITVKDMKIYYLRPHALMFGILFPIALFFTFSTGRNMPPERLIPILAAQTVFWSASSIGPASIPMERRIRTFERFLSAPISLLSVLWGKMMAGFLFGVGITTLAVEIGLLWSGQNISNPLALFFGVVISAMVYSAMGILFASIPTSSPCEVTVPLNIVRIPLMFISGMFTPLDSMSSIGVYAALLSPLTHTLDLLKLGTGGSSFFGLTVNICVLSAWMFVFLYLGQLFHKIIMKRE